MIVAAAVVVLAGVTAGTVNIIVVMITRDRAIIIVMVMLCHIHRRGEVREGVPIPCSRWRGQKARQNDAKQRAPKTVDQVHPPLLVGEGARSNALQRPLFGAAGTTRSV